MIDTKDAVRIALEHMREMYDERQIPGLSLEEIELTKDRASWMVTVSFTKTAPKSPIEAMTSQHGSTTYKVLAIDAESGLVLSMKTRAV